MLDSESKINLSFGAWIIFLLVAIVLIAFQMRRIDDKITSVEKKAAQLEEMSARLGRR